MGVGPLFLDRCKRPEQAWCEDNEECKGMPEDSKDCTEELVTNPHSWHRHASLLFIETPPPVGFSKGDINQWRKGVGNSRWAPVTQQALGAFHARALETIVSTLEQSLVTEPFESIFLGGESFAGIYLGHMIPHVLETDTIGSRFRGALIGNPKLGTRDRLEAAPAAFVDRCIMKPSEMETLQQSCDRSIPFSEQVDLKAKQPNECTKEWVSYYNRASHVTDRGTRGGRSWYNSDFPCEMCSTGSGAVEPCSPECFDLRPYERLLRHRGTREQLGADGDRDSLGHLGGDGDGKWEFCKDVSKWVADYPMVETPPFLQSPTTYLTASKSSEFRFWLFSGDTDLESLHEVSRQSMVHMFGQPQLQTPWQGTTGKTFGDFLTFADFEGARLVRIKGGGHITTYYATEASADVFRRFISGSTPGGVGAEPAFVAPKGGTCPV